MNVQDLKCNLFFNLVRVVQPFAYLISIPIEIPYARDHNLAVSQVFLSGTE